MPRLTIISFGYDRGGKPNGNFKFVADVRNIPTEGLQFPRSGLTHPNYEKVLATVQAKNWLTKMKNNWAPALKDGDQIAIGCGHGFHRAPVIASEFAKYMREKGWQVTVRNTDIGS